MRSIYQMAHQTGRDKCKWWNITAVLLQVICIIWVHTSVCYDCVYGMSRRAWHICTTICSSVHWWWRTTLWGFLGGEDPVLISCTVLISCGTSKDSSWARCTLVGLPLPMSWFIQVTATQTWGAVCLLISTAVFSSSLAQPQAGATSTTGSEVVISHTVSSHSTSHCGRLHGWRPWLPA